MKNTSMLIFVLVTLATANDSGAEVSTDGTIGDSDVSLVYDPRDGRLALDAAGHLVSTFEVISASGIFTGAQPDLVLPPFDVFRPDKFFLLKTQGIGDTDFGLAAAPRLSQEFIGLDLTNNGSLAIASLPGGDVVYVPEPLMNIWLVATGLLPMRTRRRCGKSPTEGHG